MRKEYKDSRTLFSRLPTDRQLKSWKSKPHRFLIKQDCREAKCIRCHEWWPLDTQFFHAQIVNRSAQSLTCIACENERRYGFK